MIPDSYYKPKFIKHNLFRYKEMQADLLAHLNTADRHTLFIDIRDFNEEEIRIYVKHVLLPFTMNNKNAYHLIFCVGKFGENKMTVLKNACKEHFIQYMEVTRRKLEIYG